MGKGAGGLILKPLAGMHLIHNLAFQLTSSALWGLPGYALHGAYIETQKHFVVGPNCVHLARTLQGFEESKAVSQPERQEIIKRWSEMRT